MKTLFSLLAILLFSCSLRPITGEIRAVNGDTIQIRHYSFKVLQNVPKAGEKCTFTPTKDTTKINSILLKY